MVNRKFVEKIYKFHNFNVEVDCSTYNYYSGDGQLFVVFFSDLDLVEWGSVMNLITLCETVYTHNISEDKNVISYQLKGNKVKFSEYLKEVISKVYTYFVYEMNVSKDEFRYVWDLFVNDINKVIKEKSIKLIFEDRSCKPVDINLLLLPKYDNIWDRLTNDIISPKKYDGRSRKVSITSTVRSKDFTLFNQQHDIQFIELTF